MKRYRFKINVNEVFFLECSCYNIIQQYYHLYELPTLLASSLSDSQRPLLANGCRATHAKLKSDILNLAYTR